MQVVEMIQNKDIEINSVRVNRGSGVIVSIANRYFVITALHCIDDLEQSIVSYDKKKKYFVKESYFHKNREIDIVLLEIDASAYDLLPVTFAKNSDISSEDEIKVYGFPSKREVGEPMLGKVSQWNSVATTIKTKLSYIGSNSNDEEAINNIAGWSGSGVFKKNRDGTLALIGILSNLTDKEHTYQTINCISIETIMEVIEHNQLRKPLGIDIKKQEILVGSELIVVETVDVEVEGKVLGVSIFPVLFEDFIKFCKAKENKIPDDDFWGIENRPVINISWHDAIDYCEWLGKYCQLEIRLLQSEEWEKIAEMNLFHNKSDMVIICKENADEQTAELNYERAGAIGICDMLGNVLEWCLDGEKNKKIVKGGCFLDRDNQIDINKSNLLSSTTARNRIGFRVVFTD